MLGLHLRKRREGQAHDILPLGRRSHELVLRRTGVPPEILGKVQESREVQSLSCIGRHQRLSGFEAVDLLVQRG